MSNYELNVISRHPDFSGKTLKKYYVNGIETVGAYGNEGFLIQFKNNTYQKVQVKLSVDGTDVFSGKPADTNVGEKMWVVNAYATLSLRAWPETANGGAAFVFTNTDNSVAAHTHGDLSSRGIIAAAIFVEGHIEPVRLTQEHHYHHYPTPYYLPSYPTLYYPIWNGILGDYKITSNVGGVRRSKSVQTNTVISNNTNTFGASMDSLCFDGDAAPAAAGQAELQSLVSVGAGQHVDQKIAYVAGLIKPTFTETVRVRYQWWTELQEELRQANVPVPHASGFPGDRHAGINLQNTPRLPGGGSFHRAEPISYQRV